MTEDDPQPVTDVGLKILSRVFAMVEAWRNRIHERPPSPEAGSSLAGDDKATDPSRLSHAVIALLISAVDHFETLRLVVEEQHALPARGGFTLLRVALENAAVAVWLLAPGLRDERVFRLLRWEWADAVDHAKVRKVASMMTADGGRNVQMQADAVAARNECRDRLRALAAARGMPTDRVT
jgi:hypothetical protein